MPKKTFVPISVVMEILLDLCPDCQSAIRARLAQSKAPEPLQPQLHNIMDEVASLTGISRAVMMARNNSPSAVKARRMVAVKARELGYSLPVIGAALKKHHTTILHLLRVHAQIKNEGSPSAVLPLQEKV